MGKPRLYFYKDAQGNMQKYLYCNMCPPESSTGGPFTADQEYNPTSKEGQFMSAGNHVSCAKTLGVLKSPEESFPTRGSYVGPSSKKKCKKR